MATKSDLKCPTCSAPGRESPLESKGKHLYYCKKCKSVFRMPHPGGPSHFAKIFSFLFIFACVVATDDLFLRSQGVALSQHLDIFSTYLIRFIISFIFYFLFTKRMRVVKKTK